jgi:hypothetical protein
MRISISFHYSIGSLFLLIAGLLLLQSCEKESASDVNQNKIYADYEQFYDRNTDKTTVVARFRFGGATGTLLELDSTDFVKFNGDILAYNTLYSGHVKEYAGLLPPGTFTYTNLNNNTYSNSVPSFDTISFPSTFDTLRKSQAYTLSWVGSPLAPNQNAGVFIGSWTWGQDALYYQDTDGATNIVMGTIQLNNLPLGPSVCWMDRATDKPLTQATSEGGRIRGKYRALTDTIQVAP